MTEENDPEGGPCLVSKDCTQGFSCVGGRCIPTPPKDIGCTSAPVMLLAAGGLLLWLRRRGA